MTRRCAVEGCAEPEQEVTVFRGPVGQTHFIGYCSIHCEDVELQPPAGFELWGGGSDPELLRLMFGERP